MPGLLPAETKRIKTGASFRSQCPIHGGERLSMGMKMRDSGWWFNCFACGKQGDVFTLVQAVQGVSFKDALAQLSEGLASLPWTPPIRKSAFVLICDEPGCDTRRDIESDEVIYIGRTVAVAWELHARRWRCPICSVRMAQLARIGRDLRAPKAAGPDGRQTPRLGAPVQPGRAL